MPTPTSDLSHLTTLSALAKSAEARTPLPAPAILTAGSGLIDLKAMEQRAREAHDAKRQVRRPHDEDATERASEPDLKCAKVPGTPRSS
jgi:hypothetical protein